MKTVAIATLGCKTNQFESAAMAEQLTKSGYRLIPFSQPADIYIVNSCTVTAKTDAETRKLVRRARRLNPAARIVATGCYAQVAPGELEQLPELDCVLGNSEKQKIALLVESGGSSVADIAAETAAVPLELSSFSEHTRAFLQVQNGCDAFCSYCIVPYARGRSRSVPPAEIAAGIGRMAEGGHREVVLTGIHLGAYGLDLTPPVTLAGLVRGIATSGQVLRLRLGSIEPNELDDDLLSFLAASPSACRHIHLPLQSGSDAVLTAMGRRYSRAFFRELVERCIRLMPDAFIAADVIAGFPGESEEQFGETLQLITELPLADLHVFPFSSRPGTAAAELPDHLPPAVVNERARRLRELAAAKHAAYLENSIGTEQMMLGQSFDRVRGVVRGLSRTYLQVEYPGDERLLNREVTVRVEGLREGRCVGRLMS